MTFNKEKDLMSAWLHLLGLGLSIAKRSMEYMGGDIAAESSPDGAVFTIILPQDCRSFAVEEWTEV